MGMQGARTGLDVYNQAKQKQELEDVSKAQVTELAPVSDLTSTPSEDGGPAVTTETQVAPKQFSLLGKTYDQAPTDSQVSMARNLAMAGIMKKYNPAQGMQMEQAAIASQRDEQRFDREQEQWKRNDDEYKKTKDYEEGRKSVFSSSRFGQNQQSYAKAMGEYQKRLEEYEAAKASGKSARLRPGTHCAHTAGIHPGRCAGRPRGADRPRFQVWQGGYKSLWRVH